MLSLLSNVRYAPLATSIKDGELQIGSEQILNGRRSGHFRLKLGFPYLNEAGTQMVKVEISYVLKDGKLAVLAAGSKEGDWHSLSSYGTPLSILLENGYIADEDVENVVQWATSNIDEKASLALFLPDGETFVSDLVESEMTEETLVKLSGRELKHKVDYKVGDKVNIKLDNYGFRGARILTQSSGLRYAEAGSKALSPSELLAKYTSRPVATVTPVAVVSNAGDI